MTSQLMVEPSSLMYSGIVLNTVQDLHLFKFTDELQARSDELLEKLKTGLLTSEEEAELAGISDLAIASLNQFDNGAKPFGLVVRASCSLSLCQNDLGSL